MPTCPSCGAMIEQDASACWHCGIAFELAVPVAAEVELAATGSSNEDAPTQTWTRSQRAMLGREIIGQYIILDKLGEGGMGEVYLADQPAIGRQVAIKIVHPQGRDRDHDELGQRFRNEAKAAARLSSPHIVKIFNWGELEDGTLFMAMEYLPGDTLAELLREQGSLAPELVVTIAEQICAALAEAHGAGIVHRDLKPANIMMVTGAEQPTFAKVLDFGVAKLEGSDITRTGAMFGTPQYMSPEQLRGEPLDGRSDLYSLGVMLYEMLAGALPFSSPSVVGYVTAHLHQKPPPLPTKVPRELAEVVLLLLAKQASERPATAAAVVSELRAALGGRSPAARKRARQRALRRTALVSLTGASLVAVGFSGWWLWQWQAETEHALARERARGVELEQKIRETEAGAALAREEARLAALAVREASDAARKKRQRVQRARDPDEAAKPLDPTTPSLTRTRTQLEADLREVLDQRRVPPSEVADVWTSHDARIAAVKAGELDEAQLREQLVALISLYQTSFEPVGRGDRLSLDRLERLFLEIRTETELDVEQRQAMLDAIYDEYDNDPALLEIDRNYFKRLAVAALIREHGADDDTTLPLEPEPKPEPELEPKPKPGPVPDPLVDPTDDTGSEPPLPSSHTSGGLPDPAELDPPLPPPD